MDYQEFQENYLKKRIGVDDTFRFHCRQCGKCCIHREDILLNPHDTFRAAKELGLPTREMIDQYCEVYIGDDSRFPIVRIRPKGTVRRCPLLKDRRCSIHGAKPSVCAMYPLGRYTYGESVGSESTIVYFLNNVNCGDRSEEHTVREWLSEFDFPVEDAFFLKWQKLIGEICPLLQKIEKKQGPVIMEILWNVVLSELHLNYDIEKDFLPQFEANSSRLLRVLKESTLNNKKK